MNKFAKLYEDESGQVLVKLDSDDTGSPEVRFFFQPAKLGVCSFAYTWGGDTDESWDKSEEFFESIDEKKALETVKAITDKLPPFDLENVSE